MHKLFNEILNRFYKEKKFKFYFLFFFSIIAGMFEYLGLILIFQFVLFLTSPDLFYSKKIIMFFKNYFNISNFPKISLILGILISSIYIIKNIFMIFYTKFNNSILENLYTKITAKMFENFLLSPYLTSKNITESNKINIISKIQIVVFEFCFKYINLITNIIVSVILISYLFIKFTKTAIIASSFIFILGTIEYLYLKKLSDYQNKNYNNVFNKTNELLATIIKNTKEIKINNLEFNFLEKIKNVYSKLANLNKEKNFNSVIHIYFTEISIMSIFIIILFSLYYSFNFNNKLLLSSISTICVVILRLTPNINRSQSALYSINSNKKTVKSLIDFDKQFEKTLNYKTTNEKLKLNSSIEFKNVEFSYDKKDFIKNINFKIQKGDFIFILGKNGSFKSTLTLLISGLIKPDKGEILINEKKLKEEKKWLNNIAFVSEDFTFLYDTVKENIDFKNKEILKLINEFNLEQILEKNTVELSKGEKQKLALLNILTTKKDVIILDEALSNIDIKTKSKIYETLEKLKNKKTVLIITHELKHIKEDDKVLLIDKTKKVHFDLFKNIKTCI